MKNLSILFTLAATALFSTSCGGEDELTAQPDTLTDCFAPSAEVNDSESQLRREFYATEHSYLLFNDTLRHEPIGTLPDGTTQYFTELLDIDYTIGSDKNIVHQVYVYSYLQTIEEKRAAAELLRTKIITHLPQSMRPFSWLLVRGISPKGTDGQLPAVSGQRCIAAALDGSVSGEEQQAVVAAVLAKVVGSKVSDEQLDVFYRISADDYEGYASTCTTIEKYWEYGFLVMGLNWKGVPTPKYLPTKQQDVDAYMQLVFQYSSDEVAERFADYPLVIEKADIMRQIIEQTGFIF